MPPRKGTTHRHSALAEVQTQAILRLAGKPVRVTGQTAPSDLEKLALLAEHVQRLRYPNFNPWRANFTRFRTELLWTRDEARAGRPALFPDFPYLRQVDRACLAFTPLMFEKARRMLFTWEMAALALWLLAGGNDPSWVDANGVPILMPTDENPHGGNRRVLFGAQKLEGLGGSHEMIDRMRFLVQEFEERGCRERWPEFPTFEWRFDQARASNGGLADAVPQGPDQMRGPGATLAVLDEIAFWKQAKASIASAMQTLQGGGHLIAGSSSNVGSHAALIVKGEVNRQRSRLETARSRSDPAGLAGFDLIRLRETTDGFYVGSLPHTLRSDYDYAGVTRGLSDEDIQREVLMNWNAAKGVRVFPSFHYDIHVAGAALPFDPEQPLHIGWDFGNEPACAITQLNALGQWQIFPSFSPEAGDFDGIWSFAERVADHLLREYAAPHGLDLKDLLMVHIGDPAGAAPISQAKGKKGAVTSCFDILRRGLEIYQGEDEETGRPILIKKPGWGWHVVKGATTIPGRLEAVRNRLNTLIDGFPALIVDPREEFIISCFLGAYHYHEHSDGFINVREPKKDHASHVMDCIAGGTPVETRRGPVPVEEVTPRDEVWTRSGWRRVEAAWCAGERAVVEISFSDGRTLVCTPEHRILANGQWEQASNLGYTKVCHEKRSPTTDWFTTAIPTPKTGRIGSTSGEGQEEPTAAFTSSSGRKPTGRSRRALRSIIATAIHSTTPWTTWFASRLRSIGVWMPNAGLTALPPNRLTSTGYDHSRRSGTVPRRGEPGTRSTPKFSGMALSRGTLSANTAARPIKQWTGAANCVSAENPVRLPHVEKPGLTMRSASAASAAPPSSSTSTPGPEPAPLLVLCVLALPEKRLVYDLQVEEIPEFFANGVLVHNCIGYIASRLYARPAARRDEEDEEARSAPFVSQANSSYRLT